MISIQICIISIFNYVLISAVVSDSSTVTSKVFLPKGKTVDEYATQMNDFWTDERLNTAVPKSLINTDLLPLNKEKSSEQNGEPTLIQGTVPASSITSKTAGYPTTVGRAFFADGLYAYSCSASVVTSNNKDMIFTAGHCVYSLTTNDYVTNFIFIPQYENNTRPYGTWVARHIYAMSNWVNYFDLNSDVAIVLLYTLNNQHIQDVVGSQSVGFNYGHSAAITSFGYPINYANAQIITSCSSTKYFPNYSTYTGDALPCSMNQGCSGGPWLQSYDSSSLSGIQTSVNSFTRNATPNVMYGPYFDSSVQSLYDKANNSAITVKVHSPFFFFSLALFLFSKRFLSDDF